jgi:hypothetical protein
MIPAVFASSWIVRRWSSWMSSQILSTFSVILLVLGHPELSSSTDTRPALKREYHSKPLSGLKNVLQKPRGLSRVSVADLLSFTQNSLQTHCLILPSIADKTKHEVTNTLV